MMFIAAGVVVSIGCLCWSHAADVVETYWARCLVVVGMLLAGIGWAL